MEAELTFEQLYSDLIAAHTETLPEQYFTLSEFRADAGLSMWVAKDRLKKRVASGELSTKLAAVDGCHLRIWWFNKE